VDYQGKANNVIDYITGEITPTPLVSCFVDDCLEKGKDVRRGGARYNYISPNAVGLANIADSLAVIKKKVFEEKKYSLTQVRDILAANYEGFEDIRQEFINSVPKYGNDEPYVDEIAKVVAAEYCDGMRSIKAARGGCHNPGLQSISSHILFMKTIGATPDGRTKEMLLSDGGVSASQGRDRNGVTALLKSVSNLDHERASNGSLLNVKFSPQTVEGDRGTRNMAAMIRSYFDLKGQHVQFNIVNTKTLREAQKDPEQYSDLIVRVAGFSVYFAEIDEMLQNDIIERMEQSF
jgi:formate C-acetyltransferase